MYKQWVCRYIAFCGATSSKDVGADALTVFLNELVVSGNVSASTQNQALNAIDRPLQARSSLAFGPARRLRAIQAKEYSARGDDPIGSETPVG